MYLPVDPSSIRADNNGIDQVHIPEVTDPYRSSVQIINGYAGAEKSLNG
jgi:hypothetical protein